MLAATRTVAVALCPAASSAIVAGTKLTSNGDKLARRTNAVESGPMLVMVIVVSSGSVPAAPESVLAPSVSVVRASRVVVVPAIGVPTPHTAVNALD